MSRRMQNGFSTGAGLLIVLIIGIVGFAGWFVWHSGQDTEKTLEQSAATNTSVGTKSKANTTASPTTDDTLQTVALSKSPKDLQTAVYAETSASAPTCVKDGKIVDVDGTATDQSITYVPSGYALTAIGCDGSTATLFAKAGGSWKKVGASQSLLFACSALKKYQVPVGFLQAVAPDKNLDILCLTDDPNAGPVSYKG